MQKPGTYTIYNLGKRKDFLNFSKSRFGLSYVNIPIRSPTVALSAEQSESLRGFVHNPKTRLGGICRHSLKYHRIFSGLTGRLRGLIHGSLRDSSSTVLWFSVFFS